MIKKFFILGLACTLFSGFVWSQEESKKEEKQPTKFTLEPTGRIYVDLAKYFENERELSSGAAFGDIRLGMKASMGKWSGQVVFGFAKSSISFKDIFLQYDLTKSSHLKLGHYVEPLGLEYVDGSTGNKFVTSSTASQAFAGKRNLGFQYTGWGEKFWYAGGVFADTKMAKGTNDGDQGYAFSGRLAFNPLKEEGKILHFGLAGTYRKADANGFQTDEDKNIVGEKARVIGYGSNSGTVVDNRKFINVSIADAKDQFRYAAELVAAIGPVYTQSEYFQAHTRRSKSNLSSYTAKGFYSQIGFMALGGQYKYDKKLARMLKSQAKTLEFMLRYGWTDLNDLTPLDGVTGGGKQTDITFAVNYYYSKYLNFRINYENVALDENAVYGKDRFNVVSARIQMLF